MIRLSQIQFSSQLQRLLCTFGIRSEHTSLSKNINLNNLTLTKPFSIFPKQNLCSDSKKFGCISAGKNSQVFVLSEGNHYFAGNTSSQCNCSESGLLTFQTVKFLHSQFNSLRFLSTSSKVSNQSQEKQTPKKKKMVRTVFFFGIMQQVLVQGH